MGVTLKIGGKQGDDRTNEDKLLESVATLTELLQKASAKNEALESRLSDATLVALRQEHQLAEMEAHHTVLHQEQDRLRGRLHDKGDAARRDAAIISQLRAALKEHDITDPTIKPVEAPAAA